MLNEANLVGTYYYNKDSKNWISPETGELFVNDDDIAKYKEDMNEAINLRELRSFFNNKVKE